MARLIDADQALAEAERLLELYNLAMAGAETNREINHVSKRQELFKAVRAVVNTCPTIDPVKHGYWKFAKDVYVSCSVCGVTILLFNAENPHYCPHCGAKMDQDTGGDNNGSNEAKKE